MPSPTARPHRPAPPVLPTNLDALVREALAGGDIGKLRSAMQQARQPGPAEPPAGAPSAVPSERPAPGPLPAAVPPAPPQVIAAAVPSVRAAPARRGTALLPVAPEPDGPADDPDDPLAHALRVLVSSAHAALRDHGAGRDLARSLRDVEVALASVQLAHDTARPPVPAGPEPLVPTPLSVPLPPEPLVPLPVAPTRVRPPVTLPRYRHRWLLVLSGPGDPTLGPALAAALSVDGVSARFAAIARTPRVALRGDDPEQLRAAGVAVQRLGLSAVVVAREELAIIAAPDLVVSVAAPGRFAVSATWPFDGEPPDEPPADLRTLPWSGMCVAVPGEVTIRRYRVGRSLARGRRSERVLRLGTERRLGVIDLHGPGRFLRLVAGLTDTVGLPGHDPRSALRAFKGLTEAIPDLISGCRVQGARACAPGEAPPIPEGYDGSTPIEASGWALWEEHTRMCRLLAGLPGDDVPVERA